MRQAYEELCTCFLDGAGNRSDHRFSRNDHGDGQINVIGGMLSDLVLRVVSSCWILLFGLFWQFPS